MNDAGTKKEGYVRYLLIFNEQVHAQFDYPGELQPGQINIIKWMTVDECENWILARKGSRVYPYQHDSQDKILLFMTTVELRLRYEERRYYELPNVLVKQLEACVTQLDLVATLHEDSVNTLIGPMQGCYVVDKSELSSEGCP